MTKNRLRRNLVALQIASLFFLTLLFGAGIFYDHMLTKIEAQRAATPVSVFDTKLATKIGKPFTREDHRKLVEIVESGDEGLADISKASRSLAKVALNISGLAVFLALISIFLLVRNLRDEREDSPAFADHDKPGNL